MVRCVCENVHSYHSYYHPLTVTSSGIDAATVFMTNSSIKKLIHNLFTYTAIVCTKART